MIVQLSKHEVNNLTDQEIIHSVLAGDANAFGILVSRYKNRVFTLAYNILLQKEDAEEIAQDAFVKAFMALRNFKQQSSFGTWLYRIVVNTALNKKKLKKFVLTEITGEAINEEPAGIDGLLHRFENKDLKKYLQLAIEALKEEERICITLFYLNELQVSEIHELTGISVANIKVILYRGRKHLYDALESLLKQETKHLI